MLTKKQLSAWIKKTWDECQDAAFVEKIPAYWTYMVNGTWRNIDNTEPPDDTYDEGTLESLYTAEQLQAAILAEREACAKVCEEIAIKEWDAYKGRTEPIDKDKLYNPHIEGISDGADDCAAAIRARGEK